MPFTSVFTDFLPKRLKKAKGKLAVFFSFREKVSLGSKTQKKLKILKKCSSEPKMLGYMPTIARGLGKNAPMPDFRFCDYLGDPSKITRL